MSESNSSTNGGVGVGGKRVSQRAAEAARRRGGGRQAAAAAQEKMKAKIVEEDDDEEEEMDDEEDDEEMEEPLSLPDCFAKYLGKKPSTRACRPPSTYPIHAVAGGHRALDEPAPPTYPPAPTRR